MAQAEWFEEIQAEIAARSDACRRRFGNHNVYRIAYENPYKNPNVKIFKALNPFKPNTNTCKFSPSQVLRSTSPLGNFFTDAQTARQCAHVSGHWDATAINRVNKYDRGVCWTTDRDKRCGAAISPTLLRPKSVLALSPGAVETHKQRADLQCAQAGGRIVRTSPHAYDCVAKNRPVDETLGDELPGTPLTGTDNKCDTTPQATAAPEITDPYLARIASIQNGIRLGFDLGHYAKFTTPALFSAFMHQRPYMTTPAAREAAHLTYFPEIFRTDFDAHIAAITDTPRKSNRPMLSMAQSSVYRLAKGVLTGRGLLVWHSTGSGKTCLATGIFDAFWDTQRTLLYVSSLDALTSNPPAKFRDCAERFYTRFETTPFTSREIQYLTFTRLANKLARGQLYLDNCVIVMDEVQNLFMPLPHQRNQHRRLLDELVDSARHPNLKIFVLTATPGNTIAELRHLLDIVRSPTAAPIPDPISNPNEFRTAIIGLVSYFDMSRDMAAFPRVIEVAPQVASMSNLQFSKYIEKLATVTPAQQDFGTLASTNQLEQYWAPARRYSNMLLDFGDAHSLSEFSAKLPILLATIAAHPNEKHFVYSSFFENRGYGGHGIRAIALELIKVGYQQLRAPDTTPARRFILAINSEVNSNFAQLVAQFNAAENARGETIHVFLASQKFNEGIDLKGVRHIHVFEPLVTWAADRQLVGRAVRYCSHSQLNKTAGEWAVEIHRYMSDPPITLTSTQIDEQAVAARLSQMTREKLRIQYPNVQGPSKAAMVRELTPQLAQTEHVMMIDKYLYNEARQRAQQLFATYQMVKEMAVDCRQFESFHGDVTCAPILPH